jgi:outer membrane protein OmpA-like peptidoglycan-associated protein
MTLVLNRPHVCPGVLALMLMAAASTAMASRLAAPLDNPSEEELHQLLDEVGGNTRLFAMTQAPTKDGLCPGVGGHARTDRGANNRNLEVVAYAGDDAPQVQLAIQFAHNSDVLTEASKQVLDRVAKVMREQGAEGGAYAVAGHTDAQGPDLNNRQLSCARAIAVRLHLIKRGVQPERLSAYGFGSAWPLVPGAERATANRRVELRRAD